MTDPQMLGNWNGPVFPPSRGPDYQVAPDGSRPREDLKAQLAYHRERAEHHGRVGRRWLVACTVCATLAVVCAVLLVVGR